MALRREWAPAWPDDLVTQTIGSAPSPPRVRSSRLGVCPGVCIPHRFLDAAAVSGSQAAFGEPAAPAG